MCLCVYIASMNEYYELWLLWLFTKAFLHSNEGMWRPFIMHYISVLLWFISFLTWEIDLCLWPYRITGTHVKLEQHKWVYISILCVCCVAVLGALRHFNLIFEQSMSILYNIYSRFLHVFSFWIDFILGVGFKLFISIWSCLRELVTDV